MISKSFPFLLPNCPFCILKCQIQISNYRTQVKLTKRFSSLRYHQQMHPSRIPHLSAVQRSLHSDPTAQLSRLANGTMFSRLHGLNGSARTSSSSNSTSVNNSLLRFSVEALASSAAADSGQQPRSDGETGNSNLPALGENSRLDLSNLGLMNMAARLGYGSYFGSGSASAFENFAQLSNLNSQLGADGRGLFGNANSGDLLMNNQNGSEAPVSDDEDANSITSWDEELINQETEEEDDEEMLATRPKSERTKRGKKNSENRSDCNENDEALPDDEDNIDIMDDLDEKKRF